MTRSGIRLQTQDVVSNRRLHPLASIRRKQLVLEPLSRKEPPAGVRQLGTMFQPFYKSLGLVHQPLLLRAWLPAIDQRLHQVVP